MNESTAMEQGSFLERKTPQRDNRMYLIPENGFPIIKNRTGFENILRPSFSVGRLLAERDRYDPNWKLVELDKPSPCAGDGCALDDFRDQPAN